jgi:hypothetical protein
MARKRDGLSWLFLISLSALLASSCAEPGSSFIRGAVMEDDGVGSCEKDGEPAPCPMPCVKDGDGCPPDGPDFEETFTGAGQRLHFTLGGMLGYDSDEDLISGHFSIVVHPLAPASEVLNASCRYDVFSAWERVDSTLEFDAGGRCLVLRIDGSLEEIEVTNHVTFVDDLGGGGIDAIDVEIIGSTGIAVPGGLLDFGDFELLP